MTAMTATTHSLSDVATRSLTRQSTSDYAIALLRVALGSMFLAHGLLKLLVFTLPGTAAFFQSVGFPGFAAYIVAPAEVIAGIALLVGFRTRLVAALTIPILLGALSVHLGNGWMFSAPKGGWEYPLYLVIAAVAQSLLGSGAFSLDNARNKSV